MFEVTILAQVNLFMKITFVKVNALLLIPLQVNLFALTTSVLLIHGCLLKSNFLYFVFHFNFSVYYKQGVQGLEALDFLCSKR